MFYYYGAKRRLAGRYPEPSHPLVIEPFAGAAGYSMHWALRRPDLRFMLIEKDPHVVDVWHALLALTPDEILSYPIPSPGTVTRDRFVMFAAASNAVAVSSQIKVTERLATEAARMRKSSAKLRAALGDRLQVVQGDYTQAPDVEATWFVDPPYQAKACATRTGSPGGAGYAPGCRNRDLDYPALASWCRSRRGQVIACENAGASWLPFEHLCRQSNTLGRTTTEVVCIM